MDLQFLSSAPVAPPSVGEPNNPSTGPSFDRRAAKEAPSPDLPMKPQPRRHERDTPTAIINPLFPKRPVPAAA
jgi:hypothetical protein